MTHRLIRYPRTLIHRSQQVAQKFKYLLVMDFEATCDKNGMLFEPQEIIELPCVAVSTCDWKPKDKFHAYVRPRIHSVLTPFCTDLTGIMQETVDNQPHFVDVFTKFHEWLENGGYLDSSDKSAFITNGNWDLKIMLPAQCKLDNITLPNEFKEWIDLKHVFCESVGYFPRSMTHMLAHLHLPLIGRLHSGIDDVKNMISIIEALGTRCNAQFKITSSLATSLVDSHRKLDGKDCAKKEHVTVN